MSQTSPTPNQKMVTELQVTAHLMLLDPGVFCIFHSPGTQPPDPVSGLPGVRVTRPPATAADRMAISTFNPDGWLGGENNAALVRVNHASAQVLVTIYQAAGSTQEAPKLQVLRLSEAPASATHQAPAVAAPNAAAPAAAPVADVAATEKPEVAAHVQRRGDLLTRLGDWMGERGSQNWIEGFAILPQRHVEAADIEYQAVLGKGWLSPWAEGGKYCGSRGMALPILGLRVRLKGDVAQHHDIRLHATFIDGTAIGPVDGTHTAEAPSLAPLEAFKVEIVPHGTAFEPTQAAAPAAGRKSRKPVPPTAAPVVKLPEPLPVKPVVKAAPKPAVKAAPKPAPKAGAKPATKSGSRR